MAEDPSQARRRRRRIVAGLLGSVLVAQGLFWWAVRLPVPDVEVPERGTPTITGPRATLGDSFLERRDGYWFFLHRGDAVTLGAQHAALGEFLIQRVEDAMFEDFRHRLPAPLRLLLPPLLMWQYRHMPSHLMESTRQELWAFSETYADRHSFPLSAYRRGMYYHALHDITQELVGNPWVDPAVAGACTAFATTGKASIGGHLMVGRNFDFEVFPLFDEEKVVHLFARDGAIPVLSVSWMAMAGVVTGMNAAGIWISINSARSEGTNRRGPAVSLWIREILEQAESIDDVRRLLAAQDPLVSDIFLVGDGETGEAVVIERGQTRMGERSPDAHGRLAAANHLLSPEFVGDEADLGMREHTTTLSRHQRMAELLTERPVGIGRAIQILRDRRGPGGKALPPGNRNTIDALIATHSVVADLTDRVLWVSTAPHTQGSYRAIDLFGELEAAGIDTRQWRGGLSASARPWERQVSDDDPTRSGPPDIAEGDLLRSGGYAVLERHRSFLEDAEAYLDDDRPHRAMDMLDRAEALVPGTPQVAFLQSKACLIREDEACTREALLRYMQRSPPLGPDHHRAQVWLEEHTPR